MDQLKREWTLDEIVERTRITIDRKELFDNRQNTDEDGQEIETFDDGIDRMKELTDGAIKATGSWVRPDNRVGNWQDFLFSDQISAQNASEIEEMLKERQRETLKNAWRHEFPKTDDEGS